MNSFKDNWAKRFFVYHLLIPHALLTIQLSFICAKLVLNQNKLTQLYFANKYNSFYIKLEKIKTSILLRIVLILS